MGSAVVRHIIDETNDEVVNVDKLTYTGNLESLKAVATSERYAFEQVDICDTAALERVFNEHQPNEVIHLLWNIAAPANEFANGFLPLSSLLRVELQPLAFWVLIAMVVISTHGNSSNQHPCLHPYAARSTSEY
ncbi:hypothetical protein CWE24_02065 [Pseudidiomarina donghaiensis]|uniref:NAD(P)-binding domain-containing protein n=1 Tax=Pseudidiomarina donghaiensis TaxID=519452 RepID=A0A432XKU0_9GAMM|nr:GDP-mannose 4,6-dehydratase [Pseudidiomarina donghaiensis]RUO49313.1 hypothetical protein CWE24_02065 [Pseudidiomarina donghaiensis]